METLQSQPTTRRTDLTIYSRVRGVELRGRQHTCLMLDASEEAIIQFFICKARAIRLPPFSWKNVLPIIVLSLNVGTQNLRWCKTLQEKKKQIANHTFVKENRHISSQPVCSSDLWEDWCYKGKHKLLKLAFAVECCATFKVMSGFHKAGGCNASLQIASLTWILAIQTRSRTTTPPVSSQYHDGARNCACEVSAKAPTQELSIWNDEKSCKAKFVPILQIQVSAASILCSPTHLQTESRILWLYTALF